MHLLSKARTSSATSPVSSSCSGSGDRPCVVAGAENDAGYPRVPRRLASIASSPTTQRLCVLATGVVVCHVLAAAIQERIFHLPGFDSILWLSCGETLCTAVLVGLQLLVWEQPSCSVTPPVHKWNAAPLSANLDRTEESGAATPAAVPSKDERVLGRRPASLDAVMMDNVDSPHTGVGAGRSHVRAHTLFQLPRVSWLFSLRERLHPSTVAIHWYVRIAFLMSCSIYLTNSTSFILSYALQVIFKSSKLLCMVAVSRWGMPSRGDDITATITVSVKKESERNVENGQEAASMAEVLVGGEKAGYCFNGDAPATPKLGSIDAWRAVEEGGRAVLCQERVDEGGTLRDHHCRESRTSSAVDLASTPMQYAVVVVPSPPVFLPSWYTMNAVVTPSPPQRLPRLLLWTTSMLTEADAPVASLARKCCHIARVEEEKDSTVLARSVGAQRMRHVVYRLRRLGDRVMRLFQRLRGDGELMACALIVASLCLFTYASRPEVRNHVVTERSGKQVMAQSLPICAASDGALPVKPSSLSTLWRTPHAVAATNAPMDSPGVTGGTAVKGARYAVRQLPAPTRLNALEASSGSLHHLAFSFISDRSFQWALTFLGIAAVMLSNFLDAFIYLLEEVHCLRAAPLLTPPPSPTWKRRSLDQGAFTLHSRHEDDGNGGAGVAVTEEKPTCADDLPCRWGFLPKGYSAPSALLPSLPPFTAINGEPAPRSRPASKPEVAQANQPSRATIHTSRPLRHPQIPASPQEVLFMANSIATLLYGGGWIGLWLCTRFFPLWWDSLVPPGANRGAQRTALNSSCGVGRGDPCPRGASLLPSAHASSLQLPVCVTLLGDQRQRGPPLSSSELLATPEALPPFPLLTFLLLVVLAAVFGLLGTLCLLRIVAEYSSVMAMIVTIVRKTLTILLSFLLYSRNFSLFHGLGVAGVMGGVVWYELQRRHCRGT